MINGIYKKYFQKSFTFLYPLLEISKKDYKPTQTYLEWDNVHGKDSKKLITSARLSPKVSFSVGRCLSAEVIALRRS